MRLKKPDSSTLKVVRGDTKQPMKEKSMRRVMAITQVTLEPKTGFRRLCHCFESTDSFFLGDVLLRTGYV
jgi:hypothetical protein